MEASIPPNYFLELGPSERIPLHALTLQDLPEAPPKPNPTIQRFGPHPGDPFFNTCRSGSSRVSQDGKQDNNPHLRCQIQNYQKERLLAEIQHGTLVYQVAFSNSTSVTTLQQTCRNIPPLLRAPWYTKVTKFEIKITLLRVIPTMTCRVVVVRWGLSG